MSEVTTKARNFLQFLRDSWEEVRFKVTWPSADEVRGTTAMVVVTTIIFAVYLGVVDVVMFKLVNKFFDVFA